MESMNSLIIKYRDAIPRREVKKALDVFYETRDQKIRENLIFRYMPIVKKHVLNLGITTIEEEDLTQMAYELLINCIDNYNPYYKSPFSFFIYSGVIQEFSKYIDMDKEESLTNIEVYSNEDLEDRVVYNITKSEILQIISKIISDFSPREKEILKLIIYPNYGSKCKLAKSLGISTQWYKIIEKRCIKRLYRRICNVYQMPIYDGYDYFDYSHKTLERRKTY